MPGMKLSNRNAASFTVSPTAPLIDFGYRCKSGSWQPPSLLFEKILSVSESMEGLLDVISHDGSVAKHQGVALIKDRIESRVNDIFTSNLPRTALVYDSDENQGVSPERVDFVNIDLNSLNPVGDGQYRYNAGPFSVTIPQEDRDLLCSGFLRRFLYAAEPGDLDTEKNARLAVRQNLNDLLGKLNHG